MILRYPTLQTAHTQLDPYDDLVDWISGLTSNDYVVELLVLHHGLSSAAAKARAPAIASHVRVALGYLRQAAAGPLEVSFLPLYYAILNLLKIYIIAGPLHDLLPRQRTHGVTADVDKKDSQSIANDEIVLWPKGSIPLFYRTIVGLELKKRRLRLGEIYPFMQDVEVEYALAAPSEPHCLVPVQIDCVPDADKLRVQCRVFLAEQASVRARELRVVRGMSPGAERIFQSPTFAAVDKEWAVANHLRRHLIYQPIVRQGQMLAVVPRSSRHLEFPEEIPIALFFFYLSSIARYKPQAIEKLAASKWWPLVLAARRHSVFRFLTLAWSFAHQKSLFLSR